MYPEFSVAGVKPEDIWRLFNTSNYPYYKQTVAYLRSGDCPFCQIDPTVNKVLFENDYWRLWINGIAPRPGQTCQLIIPSKNHIESISQMTREEWASLYDIFAWARTNLGVEVADEGALVLRSGPAWKNAKSVPHLHVNFQAPTGKDRVEVTIAKSEEDLKKKLPVLRAFEKWRVAESAGYSNPQEALTPEEWELIKDKMKPPKTGK